ncbi:MAG: HAMP domain-containing sensor histidine kinase [Candidatus Nitrosopolaris sp.]
MTNSANIAAEGIEVIEGGEKELVLQLASIVKERLDGCFDYTGPSIQVNSGPAWKSIIQLKNEDVKLRFITEITAGNISYCKEIMKYVEVRHIDAVKGNFGISDGKDYLGHIIQKARELPTQLLHININSFVEYHQYLFETLWNMAIPAEQKIREIEEGVIPVRTKLLEKQDEIVKEIKRLNNRANKLSICSSLGGMQMSYNYLFDSYKNVLDKYRRGESKDGIRWIINIDKESLDLVKIFLNTGIQIRHVKNMPPMNFGVSDEEIAATIEQMEGGEMSQSFLISNEPVYINHFNSLFEELWKIGIDAKDRITHIEEGADLADIEVIPSASRTKEFYLNTLEKAQKDIIIVFPTTNAFLRQNRIGAVQLAKEAAQQRNVKIRILMPRNESTEQLVCSLTERNSNYSNNNINLRYIEQTILDTQATILIVDKKVSLVMEIRDDSKGTFDEAIGLSTYSDSKAGVLSYVSIFENLWVQTELYEQIKESSIRLEHANEQLKAHDKMQQEFINIAAHELRTPIQPILSLTEILRSKISDTTQRELLDVTMRNAKRLRRLSDNILDVTRIGSGELKLTKEHFDLIDYMQNVIRDIKTQIPEAKTKDIQIILSPSDKSDVPIFIDADKVRIFQVISNLLSNAISFTGKEGTISVSVEKREGTKAENMKEDVIVTIKDSGAGIASEIKPRLFSKFATKSDRGTGLGLFISKSIVEAHGGRVAAENNADGKGATFTFTLPLNQVAAE